MSRLKVYHNGDWEYADATSEVVSNPDIVASGTYSNADNYPNQTDLMGATFSTDLSLDDLLAKVKSGERLTIGGALTRSEDFYGISNSLFHYAPLVNYGTAVVSEDLVSAMASTLPKTPDADTEAIYMKVDGTNGASHAISVIIYQSANKAEFFSTTQF